MKKAEPGDITIVYYTSNYLEEHNPYFLENTVKQLCKAADKLPMISVAQTKETGLGQQILVGDIGRSHLNIYRQILIGAKAAKTKYVALAEDDILYSFEHFHSFVPDGDYFLYDMAKLSIFTWSKPMCFSFRHDRKVINQLIAPRELLIEALEERFKRVEELLKIMPESEIIKSWGDIGRYERRLGVTPRKTQDFMSHCPSIVFSHEHAFGYLSMGERKALGSLRIDKVWYWGWASDCMKLYDKDYVQE